MSELERLFTSFVRGFHTDQFTLTQRLEQQRRCRDVSEKDLEKELGLFTAGLNEIEKYPGYPFHFQVSDIVFFKQNPLKGSSVDQNQIQKTLIPHPFKKEGYNIYDQQDFGLLILYELGLLYYVYVPSAINISYHFNFLILRRSFWFCTSTLTFFGRRCVKFPKYPNNTVATSRRIVQHPTSRQLSGMLFFRARILHGAYNVLHVIKCP